MNINRNFTIKKHHFLLILCIIIIIANIIYILPKLNDSPVPSKWSVGIDWGRYYIVNNGIIYSSSEPTLTWQSNIKNYGSVDLLPKIYFALINIITGTVIFPSDLRFHYNFPWIGTFLFPIIILYFYHYVSKEESLSVNYLDCCLIFLFAIFPLTSMLDPVSGNTNGSGIARAFFVLILIFMIIIFNEKKNNSQRIALFILILVSFFNYYHTWAYYLMIYLISIFLITILKKNQRYISSLVFLGIVFFFATAIYYNYQLFEEPITLVRFFPNILDNFPAVLYTAKVNSEYLGYKKFDSIYSYFQIINSILIILIVSIYLSVYLKLKNPKVYEQMLYYYFIAEASIILGLFIWDGVIGIYSRIFESLIYITMLSSAYLLIKCDIKFKNIIRSILLFSVLITVISYLNPPVESNWQLTDEEFIGITFAGKQIPSDSYVFSDFRLGTPLVYFNQRGIVTIDSLHNTPNITDELLYKCYYNVSEPETILDSVIPSDSYFVMTSSRQSDVFLIDSSLNRFKTAPINFQKKWNTEKMFGKIYSSEYFCIYWREQL